MGRIKTKWIKTVADRLLEKYPERFTIDFDTNKEAIKEMKLLDSKKMRNKIAGCIGKKVKKKK